MIETLRSLLYPLGFIANFLFGLRFITQWIASERKKESVVPPSFWILSLIANVLLAAHGYIQLQYPLCMIQGLNATIAWRNLNLMSPHKKSLRTTILVMTLLSLSITTLFFLQGFQWMRPPTLPWSGAQAPPASLTWHLIGFGGMLLFASRFWVQWWLAEKHQKSTLSRSFWWMSLIGATLSLFYFIRLSDLVNILGYSLGLLPYVRNLMLLKQPGTKKPTPNTLFIFAGEQSGDVLGGELCRALERRAPQLSIVGVGGPNMRAAGIRCTTPMERFQVMGITDVIKAFPRLFKEFRRIKKEILRTNPEGVLFIDYPDFNMRMAKALRKGGYRGKLIHYVCPSVWAWRKGRVKHLAKTLDRLLTILPFEKKCFSTTNLSISYVGHPLVASIPKPAETPKEILAIFPGSRRGEIERNLPIQLRVAKRFGNNYPIVISVAHPELKGLIRTLAGPEIELEEERYTLMRKSALALATSGTVVLELGLHAVPTVVTYQLSPLNYTLGRYLFRILLPFYTLPNIISEQEIFPEFIHLKLDDEEIYQALKRFSDEPAPCQEACQHMRTLLQQHNASEEAARVITDELSLS